MRKVAEVNEKLAKGEQVCVRVWRLLSGLSSAVHEWICTLV